MNTLERKKNYHFESKYIREKTLTSDRKTIPEGDYPHGKARYICVDDKLTGKHIKTAALYSWTVRKVIEAWQLKKLNPLKQDRHVNVRTDKVRLNLKK